jgi:MFS family permease
MANNPPASSWHVSATAEINDAHGPIWHGGDVLAQGWLRWPGVLGSSPRFRYLWLSRAISCTGIGVSQVALVLLAARSGPGTVSLVLLCNVAPRLLGPFAGALADRFDQRRLLAVCETGQGMIFAVIAATRPPLAGLLPLVAAAGLLATLFSPAGKSSVSRLVPPNALGRANALLGAAFNLQVVAGPAIGGVLAGVAGTTVAFAVNSGSFFASALLLTRLGPLPPVRSGAVARQAMLRETWDGLRYAAATPVLRALVTSTLVFVSFAAMDNVALVFLVHRALHGSGSEYGMLVAAFGAGMMAASAYLSVRADRRRACTWLLAGIGAGAAGTVATGLAPTAWAAGLALAVAGAGNTADLVGSDTMVQQTVPAGMLGRAFGAVGAAAQLASGIAYVAGGPLVAAVGPRAALLTAGLGMLSGAVILVPALPARHARPSVTEAQ